MLSLAAVRRKRASSRWAIWYIALRPILASLVRESSILSSSLYLSSPIMDTCQIFLFGDLIVPFEEDLRQLLHVKGNGSLSSFFDQVSFAFREQFGKLSSRQQDLLPRFTTLVDLLFRLKDSQGAPALRFALLCLYQLGKFIR